MKKIFHIVGAGRVGQTFATLLSRHPDWQLSHIVSRRLPPNAFGATVLADMADLPPADVVIIATPDNAIEATAERLAREVELTPQTVVLHLSGAKTIQVLQAVTARGALAGSLPSGVCFCRCRTLGSKSGRKFVRHRSGAGASCRDFATISRGVEFNRVCAAV